MSQPLIKNQLLKDFQAKMYVQDYSRKTVIDGVKIVPVNNFTGEDGDFSELLRLNAHGENENFPGFRIAQINRSKMMPGAVKAWHFHLKQEEIQTVLPEDHLLVGLWDLRDKSPTKGVSMRLVLGGGKAHLVYIPKGVAHGYTNLSGKPATIIYFMDQQFDIKDPDEHRLPWDSLGADFWNAQRD